MWLVTMHEFVEIVDEAESCLAGSFVEVEVGREWRSKEEGRSARGSLGKKGYFGERSWEV